MTAKKEVHSPAGFYYSDRRHSTPVPAGGAQLDQVLMGPEH